MTTVVVYDSSVLYPSTLRDLLIRLAQTDLVRARWTERILNEVFTSLRRNRPDLDPTKLNRTRTLMDQAVRDWRIDGYEHHIDDLTLPDPDDLHVLAAAIHTRADRLVTANLRDFPHNTLRQHGITPQHPDAFVLDQVHTEPDLVLRLVRDIAAAWRHPPGTTDAVLGRLAHAGLTHSAEALHRIAREQADS